MALTLIISLRTNLYSQLWLVEKNWSVFKTMYLFIVGEGSVHDDGILA